MSDETEYLGCIKWNLSAQEQMDNFRKSIRNLKAENARLQEECERMFHANVEKNRTITELVADNARLREHLTNVLPFAICSDTCFVGTCFMYQECKDDVTGTCHALIRMKELAHELGVDADYD